MSKTRFARVYRSLCAGLLILSLLGVGLPHGNVFAQDTDPAAVNPETLTLDERRELLGRLSDEQVRGLILETWGRQAADQQAAVSDAAVDDFLAGAQVLRARYRDAIRGMPQLYKIPPFFIDALIPDGRSQMFVIVLVLATLAIFALAWAAERFYFRLVRGVVTRLEQIAPGNFTEKLKTRGQILGLQLAGLAVFSATAVVALLVIDPKSDNVRLAVMTYIFAVMMFRLVAQVSRFLLAPHVPAQRLVPLDTADAAHIHRWNLWLAGVGSFGLLTDTLLKDLGIDPSVGVSFSMLVPWVFVGMLIWATWSIRVPVAALVRQPGDAGKVTRWLRRCAGEIWHIVFTLAFLGILFAAQYAAATGSDLPTRAGLGTVLLLLMLPLVGAALQQLLLDRAEQRYADQLAAAAESESGGAAQPHREVWFLSRPLIVLGLLIAAVVLLGWLWGVNLFALRQGVGGQVFDALVQILLAMIVSYLLWLGISQAMSPYMPDEADEAAAPGDDGGGVGASRIVTLMPLVKKFALVTLITMAVMVVLSALGVDIGPLIAGAGVIGIAIGFGAQSLVQDIISGLFFLMDDAFRKGEYIEIGEIRGTVERISIRSFQLRHHNGPVHTMPYGQISSITNYSRDWAMMKFEIRIPFETDVDLVRRIIKKVGLQMMEDEELKELILQPLKSQGVNRMDDSALIIRCKVMAKPGQQFYVRREAFTRIQRAFEEKGINFAPKRVIVEAATPELAAAGAAVTAETEHAPSKPADEPG